VDIVVKQYENGATDLNRVSLIQQNQVQQQDLQAQSQGQIVAALIRVYQALGGGWETSRQIAPEAVTTIEQLPAEEVASRDNRLAR
jgi:outer membrane protein TolC